MEILSGIGIFLLTLAAAGISLVILGFISYLVLLVICGCFLVGWDYARNLCGN